MREIIRNDSEMRGWVSGYFNESEENVYIKLLLRLMMI
jgi:hypothetical protein